MTARDRMPASPPRSTGLDVVIGTHNRAALLPRTLESLLAADQPDSMHVTVIVVDNRSTDDTPAVVEAFQPRFEGRLRYVFETQQGRSHAVNAGIRAGTGDLVGMIDDDEEIDRRWLRVIEEVFADRAIDFIGGPYYPRWGAPPPNWLGTSYRGAIGWVDAGPDVRRYGPGFDAMLMGGNAVIRRPVLERVGLFATDLGRTATRLLSCEDEDMFQRLLAGGAAGFYRPDLIIHHYVPPERLSKRYFRSWSFWRGVSMGVMGRRRAEPVAHVLGVPRYMIGRALRGSLCWLRGAFRGGDAAGRFTSELAWWDLAGYLYGKRWYRAAPGESGAATAEAGRGVGRAASGEAT